jgi:hypothetical protein
MPIIKPIKNSFAKAIDKITPTGLEGRSKKFKDEIISNTVNSIKNEIANKVSNLIEISLQVQAGVSLIGDSIKNIDLKSFINSTIRDVSDKINDVKNIFKTTSEKISFNEKNISDSIESSFAKINSELKTNIESAKLAADGLIGTPIDVKQFSNKKLKDMLSNVDVKNRVINEEVEKALLNVENTAKTQTSNFNISNNMNSNLLQNSKVINNELLKLEDNALDVAGNLQNNIKVIR